MTATVSRRGHYTTMKTVDVRPLVRYFVNGVALIGVVLGATAVVLTIWTPTWLGSTKGQLGVYGLVMIVLSGVFSAIIRVSAIVITENDIRLPFAAILKERRIVAWDDVVSVEREPGGLEVRWAKNDTVREYHIASYFHHLDDETIRLLRRRAKNV